VFATRQSALEDQQIHGALERRALAIEIVG
jgi:hypothetical protein